MSDSTKKFSLLQNFNKSIVQDNTRVNLNKKNFVIPKEELQYYRDLKDNSTHSATLDNIKREFIPAGMNASSYANKKITGSNRMDNNSFDSKRKAVLYKMIEQAKKRTGNKYQGTTEYKDYKGIMSSEEYKELNRTISAKVNPIIGGINGSISPNYDVATTIGRASYSSDKEGNIVVNDIYDFKNSYTQDKSGKLKKGYLKNNNSFYAKGRKEEAEKDQNLTPEQLKALKISIRLSPKDTVGIDTKGKVIPTVDVVSPYLKKLKGIFNERF